MNGKEEDNRHASVEVYGEEEADIRFSLAVNEEEEE